METKRSIYLDYCATTPVAPEVLEAMAPYFSEIFGNPSSVHRYGQRAESALEQSREDIASCLGCLPEEILFTSGGTESNNLAIRGSAYQARQKYSRNHLITTGVEHPAVLQTIKELSIHHGFQKTITQVDAVGAVDLTALEQNITAQTILVSAIYANNEIGTINPITAIGTLCHQRQVLFHTDAVQAAGLLPIDLRTLPVDMMSIGAHKFYGPKGVGVLFIRKGTLILPIQTGGSHERGMRAGTPNIPYIVGMAAALKLAVKKRETEGSRLTILRDDLIRKVIEQIPDAQLTGDHIERLPNHASFIFPGVDGNQLVNLLDMAGFACSSGSACKTGSPEPSEVLLAIGISSFDAMGSLRISLGRQTQLQDIESFCAELSRVIPKAKLRKSHD